MKLGTYIEKTVHSLVNVV